MATELRATESERRDHGKDGCGKQPSINLPDSTARRIRHPPCQEAVRLQPEDPTREVPSKNRGPGPLVTQTQAIPASARLKTRERIVRSCSPQHQAERHKPMSSQLVPQSDPLNEMEPRIHGAVGQQGGWSSPRFSQAAKKNAAEERLFEDRDHDCRGTRVQEMSEVSPAMLHVQARDTQDQRQIASSQGNEPQDEAFPISFPRATDGESDLLPRRRLSAR